MNEPWPVANELVAIRLPTSDSEWAADTHPGLILNLGWGLSQTSVYRQIIYGGKRKNELIRAKFVRLALKLTSDVADVVVCVEESDSGQLDVGQDMQWLALHTILPSSRRNALAPVWNRNERRLCNALFRMTLCQERKIDLVARSKMM
jgi:hypothetical protein